MGIYPVIPVNKKFLLDKIIQHFKEYIEREYGVDENVVDLFLEKVSKNLAQDIVKQIMDSPIENISTEIELSVENKISDTRNEKDMQEIMLVVEEVSIMFGFIGLYAYGGPKELKIYNSSIFKVCSSSIPPQQGL